MDAGDGFWVAESDGEGDFERSGDEVDEFGTNEQNVKTEQPNEKFIVLSRRDILERQKQAVERIASILPNLPLTAVRVLLAAHEWQAEKMLEAYSEDSHAVLSRVGLPDPEETVRIEANSKETTGECGICGEISDDLTALMCGHSFCGDCWKAYLTIEVREKKQTITCPGTDTKKGKCQLVLDDFTVIKLLNDEQAQKRYEDALVESYVRENPTVQWCPAAGCENAVELLEFSGERNEAVRCSCGFMFCFRCQNEEHRPCTCEMIQKWKIESKSSEKVLLETAFGQLDVRPCPRCQTPIEKNSGCNHM